MHGSSAHAPLPYVGIPWPMGLHCKQGRESKGMDGAGLGQTCAVGSRQLCMAAVLHGGRGFGTEQGRGGRREDKVKLDIPGTYRVKAIMKRRAVSTAGVDGKLLHSTLDSAPNPFFCVRPSEKMHRRHSQPKVQFRPGFSWFRKIDIPLFYPRTPAHQQRHREALPPGSDACETAQGL